MKKWFKRIAIVLLVLLVGLVIAPFLLKGKIIKLLKKEVNTSLNAQVDFNENVSLNFFKHFPKLTVDITETSVLGVGIFEGDTLAFIPKLSVSLDAMNIISGDRANIKALYIDNPYLNLLVKKDGAANWDIIKPDSARLDSSETELSFGLEKIEINNARFAYDDLSIPYSSFANNVNLKAVGDLEAENFTLIGTLETPSLDMTYAGLNFLHKVKTNLDLRLDVDMKNMRFTFKEAKGKLNELDLASDGFVQLNEEDMDFDLTFSSANTDFKNILSLVPAVYAKNFSDIETKGKMSFNGFMKGKMTEENYTPFAFNLEVQEGYFKYPNLPEAVKDINLALGLTNADGVPDHTVIDMPRFSAVVLNEKIFAKANIKTPLSDPLIDTELKGKLNLGQVKRFYPLDEKESYQGVIDADIAINSYLSYVETKQYDKVKTEGYFKGKDLLITTSSLQDQLTIANLDLSFNPKQVAVVAFDGSFGKSDFDIKGTVENLIPYLIKDDKLMGNISCVSNYFNTNPFMSEAPVEQVAVPMPQDTAPLSYIQLPANLDITFTADVKTLIYDNLKIDNLTGEMHMADQKIRMEKVNGSLLGGDFFIKEGTYDATSPSNPFSGLDFKLNKIDILKSVAYFEFIEKLGPIAKYADGLFSLDFKMGTELQNDLSPKYPTFNGEGVITITNTVVQGLKTLNIIGDRLNIDKLKTFEVKNLLVRFKIVNGNFALLDSLVLPLYKGISMKMSGGSSLVGDLNYFARFDIPRELFGNANEQLNGLLAKAKAKGINIDVSKMVPVDAIIGGTFMSPKITLDLGSAKKSLIDNVKEQAKKELTDKITEGKDIGKAKIEAEKERARQRANDSIEVVKQKAREKAQQIIEEAEARAATIKAEARRSAAAVKAQVYAQADSVQAKGTNPIEKLTSKKVADRMRLEADKKEEQAINEADKRADAIVEQAKQQAAKLEQL